jgi:hypothetical protein
MSFFTFFYQTDLDKTISPPKLFLIFSHRHSFKVKVIEAKALDSLIFRDGNWTRGYGYPRVSYPMDMDTG